MAKYHETSFGINVRKKRNKTKNEKRKDRKAQDSFRVIPTPCVNGWNC